MKRIIKVVDFNENWASKFQQEKLLLESVLGNSVKIHHIGSTAVLGVCAKPIIDILLEVESLAWLDSQSAKMEGLGYLVKGEFGIEGRRYFQKSRVQRSHHLHAFLVGSPHIARHLAFRDYLRALPETRKDYGELKKKGVKICNNDIEIYGAHKNNFIQKYERKALRWKKEEQKTLRFCHEKI